MLRRIDLIYNSIKNNTITEEEKKENKKYILNHFKYNFKELHNYLKFLWDNRNKEEDYLNSFRTYIYCLYNINTMYKEQKLLKHLY